MMFIARLATSVLPVFIFLAALVLIDSYKLVRLRAVLWSIVAGSVAAGVCYLLNSWLLGALDVSLTTYSRYAAPFVEEVAKGALLVYLIRSHRVGFLVDTAIHAFAVGAGFAFVENLFYVYTHPEATVWTWVVRGFGTSIMHTGATAIFGMVSKALYDRTLRAHPFLFLPGLALAYVLHALYNHFLVHPIVASILLVVVLPLLIVGVFEQSEKVTRTWLGVGFDTDQELLRLISTGEIAQTRVGTYLQDLKNRFSGEIVADMFCLLRLHVELSIRAKGLLMMREAGFRVPPDDEVRSKFAELTYLRESVGTTGMLAIDPFLHTSSRDLWQLNMLDDG